ncbi:MAG: T9SS type A sorting domain-containing protein [Bacteroidia bacterium]|nr:T9SS type A sorting domain-containing protein [Bacteroidia bacterium]
MKRFYLLLFCFLFTAPTIQAQLTVTGFTNYSLHGFNVLVNDQAISQHATATQNAVNYLDTLLQEITQFGLAPEILDSLRKVPIFMEWALTTGSAWYHYDVNWLIQNGYNPAKARAVEITNITNFVNWSRQNQPMVIMHELAHGYNDRVLGVNYQPIIDAYNAAMSAGIYNSVPYNPGNGNAPFNQPAYAKNNALEYFAEITEAYLGENDYFPFDSTDLKNHDALGFAVVKDVWKFGGATAIDEDLHAENLRIYPNPSQEQIQFDLPDGRLPQIVRIYNATGALVRNTRQQESFLSIENLSPGIYIINVSDHRGNNFTGRFIKE